MNPADIETTRFPTALRGYDRDAVDGFLERLAFLLRYAGAHYGIDWDNDVFVEALAASGIDDGHDADEEIDEGIGEESHEEADEDNGVPGDAADDRGADALPPPVLSEEQADRLARQLVDAIHRIDVLGVGDEAFARRAGLHEVRRDD